jgi:hypothetical protein
MIIVVWTKSLVLCSFYFLIRQPLPHTFLQFFDMSRHDAVKALNIYKRAGQQVYNVLWNFFLTVFNEDLLHRYFLN